MFYRGDIIKVIGKGDGVDSTLGDIGVVYSDLRGSGGRYKVRILHQGNSFHDINYAEKNIELAYEPSDLKTGERIIENYNSRSPESPILTRI